MKIKASLPLLAISIISATILSCNRPDTPETISQTQVMPGTVPESEINYNTLFEATPDTRLFDIVALANSNDHLSRFAALLEETNLDTVLESGGSYTVFIPTNEAFNKLHPEEIQQLTNPENDEIRKRLVQAHIVSGELYSNDLEGIKQLKTTDGVELSVSPEQGGYVTIGGARIVKPNVAVSNGIVHIVDKVILNDPEAAKPNKKL